MARRSFSFPLSAFSFFFLGLMRIRVLAFAQASQILGFHECEVECGPEESPRAVLNRHVPGVDFRGMRVALDLEYRPWDAPMGTVSEMAIIPPVSGG